MNTLPRVATNINVYCKKCETERYFKVVTHTSDTTAKLKCEVCGASRKYTLGEEDKLTAVPKAKKAPGAAKVSKAATAWNQMKESYKGGDAISYTTAHEFKDKQSLMHPTFGLGFITKTHAHKIEVVFADGTKELLHSRK